MSGRRRPLHPGRSSDDVTSGIGLVGREVCGTHLRRSYGKKAGGPELQLPAGFGPARGSMGLVGVGRRDCRRRGGGGEGKGSFRSITATLAVNEHLPRVPDDNYPRG